MAGVSNTWPTKGVYAAGLPFKNVNYVDFIEMLEFLCCFGKNVVSKAIKMKNISHISQHMWHLRAFF